MKRSDIDSLLTKYYEGTASKEEEDILSCFFKEADVPDDLKEEQAFFRLLHDSTGVPDDKVKSLDLRLETMIDGLEREERAGNRRRRRHSIRLRLFGSVAAAMLILLSSGIYLHNRDNIKEPAETDEQTYARAQYAIMKFSSTLNKGLEQMDKANKNVEDMSRALNEYYNRNKDLEE